MCTSTTMPTTRKIHPETQPMHAESVVISCAVKQRLVTRAGCEQGRSKHRRKSSSRSSVRFHPVMQVRRIHLQRNANEHRKCWYTLSEYKDIQVDNKVSLQAVRSMLMGGEDGTYDPSLHCFRGLESVITSKVYKKQQETKNKVVNGVLMMQDFQRALGLARPDNLAVVSEDLSKESQRQALMLAEVDARHRSTNL